MTRIDVGGLMLNAEVTGHGPPVVLLHGFTGSGAGWSSLVAALAPEYTTIGIDIVGHGASDSPVDIERYGMPRVVDDLVTLVRRLGHERACWLGYSMGGRTALQVAVQRPDAVAALVLEGATPGLATAEERAARVAADEALAAGVERDGIEAFVSRWENVPLFATQSEELRAALRPGRLAQSPRGLANSLRGMGTGAQPAVHDRLTEVTAPVLLLAGELDTKFAAIAAEMAHALPDATMHLIEGAGHAAHLERPERFNALVLEFLRARYAAPVTAAAQMV